VTEYKPNIFFKIWRVYPIESATLDLDHKDLPRGRANTARPSFFWGWKLKAGQGMKRAEKGKAPKSSKKATAGPKRVLKQVDLVSVQKEITNLVGDGAVGMVETTMKEVGKGHYLAMKFLFEMVGLCPAITPEEAPREDSLARMLLCRLQLPEETNPGAEVTNDCVTKRADGVEQESDAVK
jgi:hypothetical protein